MFGPGRGRVVVMIVGISIFKQNRKEIKKMKRTQEFIENIANVNVINEINPTSCFLRPAGRFWRPAKASDTIISNCYLSASPKIPS